MKRLAWGLVLISAGVATAQEPANSIPQNKTRNAKATQESVGASGKDTQAKTTVKPVSATTSSPTASQKNTAQKTAKKPAAPLPLYQQPVMVNMLQRSNGIRARSGLRSHRLNPALCQAAQNHAEYMASTGSFSHYTNGGYVARARRFGFRGGVRENIGWNYVSIDQAFGAWQGSGGHYAAIVSPETSEAGFGYARSPNGQTYWVSVYGAATSADVADAQTVFARDKERAEATKLVAEEAGDGSKVVTASAEDVKDAKPAETKVQVVDAATGG